MRHKFAAILGFVLGAGVLLASGQVKTQDDVIKVNTALVSVPVIVSDRNGRYIPDLRSADFTVLQDGTPQKIEFFAAVEEPLNVALLIDTSQSTRGVLGDIKDAASNFIKLLQPADQAMIVTFDYETHVLSPLTADREKLKRALGDAEIPEYFGTSLRDAVTETVVRQFKGVNGRKAIVLLTDGKDAGSEITKSALLYSLQESDVMIYTVFFKTGDINRQRWRDIVRPGDIFGRRQGRNGRFPRDPVRRDDPQRRERIERQNEYAAEFLEDISRTTAGRFYESKTSKLKETFGLIIDELRHQCRLGFYPPDEKDTAAVHAIKVQVGRPDVVVRARSNYRVKL